MTALLVGGWYGYRYVSASPPSDVGELAERAHEPVARIAENALARCREVEQPGIGVTMPRPASPAAGTELAAWPELLDVRAGCMRYTPDGPYDAVGDHFAALAPAFEDTDQAQAIASLLAMGDPLTAYAGTSRLDGWPWDTEDTEGRLDDAATVAWRADLVRVEVRRRMPDDVGFAYVVAYLRRAP